MNLEGGEIKNIVIKNVVVTHENKPSFLSENYDHEIVSWTIIDENFHDPPGTEYKSESMDVFGTTHELKIASENRILSTFADYDSIIFSGEVGDLEFSNFAVTTENFEQFDQLNFSDWYLGGIVKLVATFAYKNNYDSEDTILISQAFHLSLNYLDAPTPSSEDFAPEEKTPTPTPTPYEVTDLTSWFRFDYAVLNTVNNDFSSLLLYNTLIDNFRPEFLSKEFGYETIAFVIVKRSYSSNDLTDAFINGTDAFGYTTTLLECKDDIPTDGLGRLDTFASYKSAVQSNIKGTWGFVDFYKLTFEGIDEWREGEDLDLIILFGGLMGNNLNFYLQERMKLYLNGIPTPTPNSLELSEGGDGEPPPILDTTKTTSLPTSDVTNYFNDGYEVNLNADGNVFVTSAKPTSPYEMSNAPLPPFGTAVGQERVEVYANKSGGWEKLGNTITNPTENELFGTSTALNLDGSIMAVGSPMYNGGKGCVRIYRFNGADKWEQIGDTLVGKDLDEFGYDIKLNYKGDIILIGCPGNNRVLGYKYNGTSWIQLGDPILRRGTFNRFGSVMDLNGEGVVVVIGTNDTEKGNIQIYEFNGVSWRPLGSIDKANAYETLGNVLSISAERNFVAVGVKGVEGTSDKIKIYHYFSAFRTWINTNTIAMSGSINSLILTGNGDLVVAGYTKYAGVNSTEEIAIFNMNGKLMTNLGQRAMTAAYNPISVSRLGDTLIVGAPTYDNSRGTVEVYETSNLIPTPTPTPTPIPTPTPTPSPTPTPFKTQLLAPASKGDTRIEIAPEDQENFSINEKVVIDEGTLYEEYNEIVGFGSLLFRHPLKYDHGTSTTIQVIAEELYPTPTPTPTQTPTPTPTPVVIELPKVLDDDVFLVRTTSGDYNSIYQFMHSFSPLYVLKRPLSGEDYVMSPDGDKVDLPLEDAKKLLFDHENDSDILFDDKFLKWNLTDKNKGQWDVDNPENFDTNDPRMKLQRINTGCPTGCYYPNRGYIFQQM